MRLAEGVRYPIHDLIARRFSARAFDPRPLDDATLGSLFEAARWAPSSGNEQPWRFVVARREDATSFARVLGALTGRNPSWARDAGALVVCAPRGVRGVEGRPNAHAWHDAGLALGMLVLQATALGLNAHPMAGFDAGAVRAACALPEGFEPATVTALGWPGDPDALAEPHRGEERSPRHRRPLEELVFDGRWGTPASFLGAASGATP